MFWCRSLKIQALVLEENIFLFFKLISERVEEEDLSERTLRMTRTVSWWKELWNRRYEGTLVVWLTWWGIKRGGGLNSNVNSFNRKILTLLWNKSSLISFALHCVSCRNSKFSFSNFSSIKFSGSVTALKSNHLHMWFEGNDAEFSLTVHCLSVVSSVLIYSLFCTA